VLVHLIVVEQAGSAESAEIADNATIADGELKIPPGKPAGWPVDVTFALDTSGLLHVDAGERETERGADARCPGRRNVRRGSSTIADGIGARAVSSNTLLPYPHACDPPDHDDP